MKKTATLIAIFVLAATIAGCNSKNKRQENEVADALQLHLSKVEQNAEVTKVSATISATVGFDITGTASVTMKTKRPMVMPLHIEASDYLEQARLAVEGAPIQQSVILNQIIAIISSISPSVKVTIPSGTQFEAEYCFDARLSENTAELTNLIQTHDTNWGNHASAAKDSRYLTERDNVFDSDDALKTVISEKVKAAISELKEETIIGN